MHIGDHRPGRRGHLPVTVRSGWAALAAAVATAPAAQAQTADEEVRRIAARADVTAAVGGIAGLSERGRTDLVRLTEIPAPPFGEAERGRAYAALLRDAGADSVWTDAEGNVLALRRGRTGGRTVAISGHLDTVFPEGTDVSVTQRGDTLLAPGIGDDTWGLVVVLTVLRALVQADLRTEADLLFIGTVGEEGLGDLRGVKHLFGPEGTVIDAFISVDGAGLDRVVAEALGSHRYRVTYHGPGGHSWGAFGLANPHHALGRAIASFAEVADAFTREGARTSYNVGRIGGGTSVNSVPFESWMEVDMRSESPERLLGIDSLFRQALRRGLADENAVRRRGDSLRLQVEMIGNRPSGALDPATPLVTRALAATRYVGGQAEIRRSSTDANIPISLGIPAVTIGGGARASGAHSLDEWWMPDGADRGIMRALLLLVAEAGLAP